jgi:hypothetical protein
MKDTIGCDVILVTNKNLESYILSNFPLHEAYEYLSETHKADYLRTYFMHFYGGGYSDIKYQTGNWKKSFEDLYNSDCYISGYSEPGEGAIACDEVKHSWKELVGNGAYISKPNTPFTQVWYSRMIALLDTKLEELKKHPSTFPQDCRELGGGYPIEWNEMLGRIFHKVCFEFKDKIQQNVPIPVFGGYR